MAEKLSLTDLAAVILPWAKAEHPDWYQEALKYAPMEAHFRARLLRLVEIRIQKNRAWAAQCPMTVLDETKVVLRYRRPDGAVWVVGGAKADPSRLTHRFFELALAVASPNDFDLIQSAKQALDLVLVP